MAEVRDGYKMTELGEIPLDWETRTIEDIVTSEKNSIKIGPFGSQLKKEFLIEDGYRVYGQENVFKKDFNLGSRYISETHFQKLKTCELVPGDFVITMMGTIGKCFVVPSTIKRGIMDSHLLRLRLNKDIYINGLLLHVINSDLLQAQIKNLSVGGIMAGLSSKIIRQLILPVPSLKEQQKIAEILSTVDKQIEQTEKLIEKTKELKKGLMQQLLTKGIGHTEFKPSELGEIPTCWDITSLESVSITKGSYGIGAKAIEFDGSKPRYLRITDFNEDGYLLHNDIRTFEDTNDYDDYLLEPGDIVFARTGNSTGKVYRYKTSDGELVFAGFLIRFKIKPDVADVSFVFYQTQTQRYKDWIKKMSMRSGQPGINSKEYGDLQLFLPSLDEQQKIAEILSTVDEQIETYEKEKAKYEKLKKGLMQQLLTGKVRVKVD